MIKKSKIPLKNYGVIYKDVPQTEIEEVAEQVRRLGYAVLDSGYSGQELSKLSEAFDLARGNYLKAYGEARLRNAKELQIIRALLTHGDPAFIQMATNQKLLNVLDKLILGTYVLNQQNGIINPPGETYTQGAWHRDLPYQHFISQEPLAVNALFCIDDFTLENGSTFVLPATHKTANYPSESYIRRNALQVEAAAGSFILMDCMIFHSGGFNLTDKDRRAVNHVYTIPVFKQQIKLPDLLKNVDLSLDQQALFGFKFEEPCSIDEYLTKRTRNTQEIK